METLPLGKICLMAEGYYRTTNFLVMKALYYMSYIAGATNDTPKTPTNSQLGNIYLPHADEGTATGAPMIQQPRTLTPMPAGQGGGYGYGYDNRQVQGYQVVGDYEAADRIQYHDGVNYTFLEFKPWITENNLGPKNWIAKVSSDQSEIVLKLWDAWKCDTKARDHETDIYMVLRSLGASIFLPSAFRPRWIFSML